MAKSEQKTPSDFGQQAIALAEQLGRIAGTIEGTAEAWMNRQSLADQLMRVRDGAAQMLESLTTGAEKGRKSVETAVETAVQAIPAVSVPRPMKNAQKKKKKTAAGAPAAAARRGDPAHAPGKRRRKPAPTMRGVKTDESIPKLRTAVAVRQRRKSYA